MCIAGGRVGKNRCLLAMQQQNRTPSRMTVPSAPPKIPPICAGLKEVDCGVEPELELRATKAFSNASCLPLSNIHLVVEETRTLEYWIPAPCFAITIDIASGIAACDGTHACTTSAESVP